MNAFSLSSVKDTSICGEPTKYTNAFTGPNVIKWLSTMKEDMDSLHQNQTWEFMVPPKGKKIVGCNWV